MRSLTSSVLYSMLYVRDWKAEEHLGHNEWYGTIRATIQVPPVCEKTNDSLVPSRYLKIRGLIVGTEVFLKLANRVATC